MRLTRENLHKIFLALIISATVQISYYMAILPAELPGKHFRQTGETFSKWELATVEIFAFGIACALYFLISAKRGSEAEATTAKRPSVAPQIQRWARLLSCGVTAAFLGIFQGMYSSYANPHGFGLWLVLASFVALVAVTLSCVAAIARLTENNERG